MALAPLAPLAGCNRPAPTTLEIVAPATAPGLASPKKGGRSGMTLHEGDVLVDRQTRFPGVQWSGEIEGKKMERDGDVIEFKRSQRDGSLYAFESDVRRGVPVTSAGWLCSTSPTPIELAQMPCVEVLQRIRIDDRTTAAFLPCLDQACPVGLASGSNTTWITIDGLSGLRLLRLGGRPYLGGSGDHRKGTTRGVAFQVLDAAPGLARKAELVLEATDSSRPATTAHRSVKMTIEGDAIRLVGAATETNNVTGMQISSTPIDEIYRFAADGKVTGP
jgi:phage tail protein X